MEKLFEELRAMCEKEGLIFSRFGNTFNIHAWEFQLADICKYIRDKGIQLKEFSFGGRYRSLIADVDGYHLNLSII